jgi:hypothetical protein
MTFSRHARNRMRRRKITPADVEAIVANPEKSDVDDSGKIRHYGTAANGRYIRIVLASENPDHVVSVHERRR